MARERNPHVALAIGTLAASAVLIAPIAVWTRFGDADPLRTSAVALAALVLCGVVVSATTRRYAARLLHTFAHVIPLAAPRRSHDVQRTTAQQRVRRDPSTCPCGPSRCRPRYTSRGTRDVACRTATPPLGRRGTRRRTRP
jgi:hypothetical protein